MTNEDKQGGCCGGHDKNSEQDQPKKEGDGCCQNKDNQKPEKDKSDNSGGCCSSN